MDEIVSGRLKTFDAFPKVSSSYSIRSTRGGYATILLTVGCLFFIWIQFAEYLGGIEEHQFTVDKDVGRDMQINVDMTVAIHCDKISVNVLDKSMDRLIVSELLKFQKTDFEQALKYSDQIRLDDSNLRRETLHGVLRRAKRARHFSSRKSISNGQACRIYGSFPVTKVQGDFHIISKEFFLRSFRHDSGTYNFTHIIDEFSFGEYYPKLVNPLDGIVAYAEKPNMAFQYFLSVVPTTYKSSATSRAIVTNQYAVTELLQDMTNRVSPPGLFFKYDIEPVALTITDARLPFSQFLMRLVNIIGGVVVCTGACYRMGESLLSRIFGRRFQSENDAKEGIIDQTEKSSSDFKN